MVQRLRGAKVLMKSLAIQVLLQLCLGVKEELVGGIIALRFVLKLIAVKHVKVLILVLSELSL